MARQFGFAELKTILVERVGLPEEEVIDDPSTTFDQLGLDSLAFVEIQLAVQQEYGFTIPDQDAHHIKSFKDAIDYTNRRLQEEG
jgi:acyl carrier protein